MVSLEVSYFIANHIFIPVLIGLPRKVKHFSHISSNILEMTYELMEMWIRSGQWKIIC